MNYRVPSRINKQYREALNLASNKSMSSKVAAYQEGGMSGRTPRGHFVVYVGACLKRFVLPVSYLKKHSFQQLLQMSAEMYGFDNRNGIVIPCDESTFRSIAELEEGK